MVYRIFRALLILALSGPLSLSTLLSLHHFLQVLEETRSGSCESPSTRIHEDTEAWISGSHARQLQPVHLCGVGILSKNMTGAVLSASSPTPPLFCPASFLALECGEKSRSPGFFRVSRSPPNWA
ncbi:MAG: hypothetical protein BMS9Abin37_0454 [Acidobacteriota bacterium]|nr:MAG: hypothetical protein BMS9Abin37_0454 [Acidobacteriota bacterium]